MSAGTERTGLAEKLSSELKAKWVAALRSGTYNQIDGALCRNLGDDGVGHCCLGVLAEVAGVNRRYLFDEPSLDEINRKDLLGGWYPNDLDDDSEQTQASKTIQRQLADMNDDGKSFTEIADWVEANL